MAQDRLEKTVIAFVVLGDEDYELVLLDRRDGLKYLCRGLRLFRLAGDVRKREPKGRTS